MSVATINKPQLLSKRTPPRFQVSPSDIYITKKTKISAQFNRCKGLLDKKSDEIVIHALGNAVNRAINLACQLENAMQNSLRIDMLTSSVTVTDDLLSFADLDDFDIRQRNVSAVHILVSRI